ncbi:MAG: DUF3800 domain-containing protein [Terracidiphilus sp.]
MSGVAYLPAGYLLRALHDSCSKRRWICMLKAFMDESGHSKDPACAFIGMGGIVADETAWIAFDEEWRNSLEEFIDGKPFHMKDFVVYPPKGLYEGWAEEKRREFLGKLVQAILNSGCRFVGCVVSGTDFSRLPLSCKNALIDPFYIAFQTVTRGMALIAQEKSPARPDPVALMYSQQETFGVNELGRAQQLWLALQEDADYGKWIGPYSFDNPRRVRGLQAVDLFAYELTQEFEHFFGATRRPMRWALKQFVQKEGMGFMVKFLVYESMMHTLLESGFLPDEELSKFNQTVNYMLYSRAQE